MINKTRFLLIICLAQAGLYAMDQSGQGRTIGSVDPSTLSEKAAELRWQQLKLIVQREAGQITRDVHELGSDVETAQTGLERRMRAAENALRRAQQIASDEQSWVQKALHSPWTWGSVGTIAVTGASVIAYLIGKKASSPGETKYIMQDRYVFLP